MTTIALVDGDIFAYEAAAAAEEATDWGDGLWTLHAWEGPAKETLVSRVNEAAEAVNADRIIVALSDVENFRKSVLPTYKSNRVGVRKPMVLQPLRQHLRDTYEVFERPGLEGDDVLGILSTWDKLKGDKIIVSKDKDFRCIPGRVFYTHRPDDGIQEITEHQADLFHMTQTLTGDTTDGYKGCPGCGPKCAEKVLAAALEEGTPWANPNQLRAIYWKHVVAAYVKAKLCEEEALVQARVARILRASDYDFKNKRPILWTPPSI